MPRTDQQVPETEFFFFFFGQKAIRFVIVPIASEKTWGWCGIPEWVYGQWRFRYIFLSTAYTIIIS